MSRTATESFVLSERRKAKHGISDSEDDEEEEEEGEQ